jgi:hypothetical protein
MTVVRTNVGKSNRISQAEESMPSDLLRSQITVVSSVCPRHNRHEGIQKVGEEVRCEALAWFINASIEQRPWHIICRISLET